jgi:hypothetical protein
MFHIRRGELRKFRLVVAVPVLALAALGLGQSQKALAAKCTLSLFPGQTAVYSTPYYGGVYNISGGAGVAAFYRDPFGTLSEASPTVPTAVYYSGTYGGWDEFGDSGVATICSSQ